MNKEEHKHYWCKFPYTGTEDVRTSPVLSENNLCHTCGLFSRYDNLEFIYFGYLVRNTNIYENNELRTDQIWPSVRFRHFAVHNEVVYNSGQPL